MKSKPVALTGVPLQAADETGHALLPISPNDLAAQDTFDILRGGVGYSFRLEKLRSTKEHDPEVARIFEGLRTLLDPDKRTPDSPLGQDLRRRGSISREVLGAYLEWVAHRGAKAPAESEVDQEKRRELDPALMRTRVDAIIDLIVERIVQLGAPIPETHEVLRDGKPATIRPAHSLLSLLRGGAERIQTRADTWMLNSKISELYETEKILLAGVPVDAGPLWEGLDILESLDGGTPMGFQKPLEKGERRLIWGSGWVEHGQLPAVVSSTALVKQESGSLVVAERKSTLVNVLQQSAPSATAIAKIEAKLGELDPRSPEYAECLDVYSSYTSALLYDSRKIWANSGLIDRLAEAVVTMGGREHREAMLAFMYEGIGRIRDRLFNDFNRRTTSYRDVYLALANLVMAREPWDAKTLDFVFEKIAWLQTFPKSSDMSEREADSAFEEIVSVRRDPAPDAAAVLEVMAGGPADSKYLHYGAYTMKLAVRDRTADGVAGKVLELKDLRTDLKEDSELFETIRRLQEMAKANGFTAMELADWRNIHEARVFRASGDYREHSRPRVVGQGRALDDPTFIKDLSLPDGPAWDLSDLRRYLDSSASRGLVRIGNFQVSFRKESAFRIDSKKTLTLTLVDADRPGSGLYEPLLRSLEKEAKKSGFDAFLIEGVDDPRHFGFYENRMKYRRVPKTDDRHRSYYTKIS